MADKKARSHGVTPRNGHGGSGYIVSVKGIADDILIALDARIGL